MFLDNSKFLRSHVSDLWQYISPIIHEVHHCWGGIGLDTGRLTYLLRARSAASVRTGLVDLTEKKPAGSFVLFRHHKRVP